MSKGKIVIALGGNALGTTLSEQMSAVKISAKAIVDLIEEGYEVVITHGNGPQSGLINNAMIDFTKANPKYGDISLSMCVAMSQAYIGYDLQNAVHEELINRNIFCVPVVSLITQVRVDPADPAFANPTKPIGAFMTKEKADEKSKEYGYTVKEDAGRGYRRVVASPKPQEIIEIGSIRSLLAEGQIVIACGGGGIPVISEGNHLRGVSAVIDKDFAAALLAREVDADFLIILTAVEKVAINFGKIDQQWLDVITSDEAKEYIAAGHFAPGSMLPKVQAAVEFAESKENRKALITLLEKAKDGIQGKTGTLITK
ncbi:carbamate kinase [Treponema socranskii]|uniref:carbamate kinase n=1 Tax=Treponema socranskii TaxID=53419 RepID=UPI003D92AAAA